MTEVNARAARTRVRDRLGQQAGTLGLLSGALADVVVPDPRGGHPVAAFGRAAAALERAVYGDSRQRGAAYATACVLAAAGTGVLVRRAVADRPLAATAATTAATWVALGGTSLCREVSAMAAALEAGDTVAARARLPNLCARDPASLDIDGLVRASIESVAENTVDAVVAPLLWGAVAGVPGLLAYRAVNTLDAMVGYRSSRYIRFGWAAAKLDDAANLAPARLTGLLAVALAPCVSGSRHDAWPVLLRDGARHPSPNAGHAEAAFAGALGVRLGGVNSYGGVVEHRSVMGHGRAPDATDLRRSVRLAAAVGVAATVIATGLAAATRAAGVAVRRVWAVRA